MHPRAFAFFVTRRKLNKHIRAGCRDEFHSLARREFRITWPGYVPSGFSSRDEEIGLQGGVFPHSRSKIPFSGSVAHLVKKLRPFGGRTWGLSDRRDGQVFLSTFLFFSVDSLRGDSLLRHNVARYSSRLLFAINLSFLRVWHEWNNREMNMLYMYILLYMYYICIIYMNMLYWRKLWLT